MAAARTAIARLRDLAICIVAAYTEPGDQPEQTRCTFSRRSGQEWRVVPPPSRKWLKFCEWYGEPYHVVTAEEAAMAAPKVSSEE